VAERCVINPELPPASKSWLRPATIVKLRSGTAVRVGKLAATIASSAAAITSPTRLIASQLLIQSYHGQEDSAFGDIRQTSSSVPCTQRPVQHQKKCDGEDRPSPAPRLVQHHAFVPLRGAELPQARPNTTRRPRLSGNSPRPSDGPGPRSCRRGPGYQMTMKEWGGRRAWPHGRNVLQFQLMTNSQFHLLFKDRVESGGENQPQTRSRVSAFHRPSGCHRKGERNEPGSYRTLQPRARPSLRPCLENCSPASAVAGFLTVKRASPEPRCRSAAKPLARKRKRPSLPSKRKTWALSSWLSFPGPP
jgi:hypothetical protein